MKILRKRYLFLMPGLARLGEIPDYIKERIIISDISVEKESTNTVTRGYGKTNFYTRLSKIIEKINLSNDKENFMK